MESQPRELKGKRQIEFNLATVGLILPFALYSSYAYYYYTYVIGLDALLSSIGLVIGLLTYAIGSPILGVLSDNRPFRKNGKRRPFLIYGLPLIIILGIVVWTPPVKCALNQGFNWFVALYFWVISFGFNLGLVIVQAPYLAMIPEQSETEKNRVEIATMQGLFSICGTVIGAALPIYLESFLQNPTQAYWGTTSGQFLTTIVPIIGLGFVILALVCILITYFTLDESFLKDQQPTEKETLKSVVNQMVFPLKDANTRWFLGIIFGFNMAMRALITVVLPLITIVLLLKGTEIVIFIVVLAPFALVGFFFWSWMTTKIGLKKCFSITLLIITLLLFVSLVLLVPIQPFLLKIGAGILIGIALACLVGGFLFPNPLMSSIIDDVSQKSENNDPNMRSKISGAYFGINLFIVNFASAIANMLLGFIFTGGNQNNSFLIIITLPITGIIFGFAWVSVNRIHLKS